MSIVKIARIAGVSTATVSRVINAHPHVSLAASQAVNTAIEQLEYQPRKMSPRKAKDKRSGRPHRRKLAALALVMPEVRAGFMPSLIRSFDSAAGEFAYQVVTCNTDNSSAKQADVIVQLIENRIAGVALMPTTIGPPAAHQIRHLQTAGIPVVLLHRDIEGAEAPLIAFPYAEAGHRAGKAIIAAGHRRAAVFFAHDSPIITRKYERGFREALTEHGLMLPDHFVHFGSTGLGSAIGAEHEAGVEGAVAQMMELPDATRPTAIFAPWEVDAELLYVLLLARGFQMPGDVSLVSLGSTWRGSAISRRLYAVTVDEIEIGRLAARLLINFATGQGTSQRRERHVIPLMCHEGQTLGPPPSN